MMNANISTQRRMRRTHAKFAALSAAAAATNNASGEDGENGDVPTTGPAAGSAGDEGADDAEADAVDERPWPVPRQSQKSILDGLVDPKPDIGELAAERCMQWVNRKFLEHVGFQGASGLLPEMHGSPSWMRAPPGSSQLALDVLSDITVEYLSNVGRTFRLYLDKYSNMMTAEVCHRVSFFVAPAKG
jgi:transcriptional activator SPT7